MSTQNVNPNSRAAFVDEQGRLTKYGQDIIRALYSALNMDNETTNVDDLETTFDVDIATANLRGALVRLSNDVEEIENDYETATFKSRIKRLEDRMHELEFVIDPLTRLNGRLIELGKQIDDIEAQL